MNQSKLEFLKNQADEAEGLGHAGIETYRDDPYASVAREIGQNSNDAALTRPVRIQFDLEMIDRADIPALEDLVSAIDCCLSEARSTAKLSERPDHKSKEVDFFENASRIVNSSHVPVLKIADYNTTGLTGPAERGSVFHSLVKGSGVSKKQSDTSGGSFGIGKNAVFAVSDLQAVFYATRYQIDAENTAFLAQGKVSLMSHTAKDGVHRLSEGYWGRSNFKAHEDPQEVPEWLRRDELGTTVCAVGFRNSPDWKMRITYSLIENFFYAVHKDQMEFSIDDGSTEINRNNLSALFSDEKIRAAAKSHGAIEKFSVSEKLYYCISSEKSVVHNLDIHGLGKVQVTILVEDDLPKKVCILRNGMLIADNLSHFGDAFARFDGCRDFIAVVVPLDDRGIELIKRLENPRHDGLSAERLISAEERSQVVPIIKRLAKEIRSVVRKAAVNEFGDSEDALEMRQYFGDDPGHAEDAAKSSQDNPEKITYTVMPRDKPKKYSSVSAKSGDGGGKSNGEGPGPGGGRGPRLGKKPRPFTGENSGKGASKSIYLEDVRYFSQAGEIQHRLFFTPEEGGTLLIKFEATGVNEAVPLVVIEAENGSVKNGRVSCEVSAGTRHSITVRFAEKYSGPVSISAEMSEI
ncbi:hypothetical protein [Thalassospira xiamenensis]|uniref:Uncharacterized protein n=1 Tax=Thalassospira xiamenensis TaxID=220697 RepID=A0A367XGK0_9PROT|nr:hypothetical protein [Thalassospira xiamenensis]KZB54994.1 hypothetical protein AUP41_18250 [Thalassospira xiamenensis]RCK51802.1 hypothetical protein TH44_05080 [Thalassospira xiamenensis]